MKATTKLSIILLTLATVAAQESMRIKWNNIYSPSHGWQFIKHRSQKKLRRLRRQRGG